MASLVTYGGGLRRIEFLLEPNGKRLQVRLGRVTIRNGQSILAKVERLIADRLAGRSHDEDVSRWLASLDEQMLFKLRAVGLAEGVGLSQTTLGEFLERVKDSQTVKPATEAFYGHTRRNLLACFGAHRAVVSITEADADAFRSWLTKTEGLAAATVGRRVVAARTMWRMAIRWRLTNRNPFAGIKGGTQENASRKHFVSQTDVLRVMEEAPNADWRCILALARFGGLRCPSEVLLLRWQDIDWERGTMLVRSPKTEHHAGHAARTVPLFEELRPVLLDAFEEAEPGTERVVAGIPLGSALNVPCRRLIAKAKLEAWPRTFQNMRASRESELMREYDLATVCKWIGNSPAVAAKHYAMSLDRSADLERATGRKQAQQNAQQIAQQPPAAGPCQGVTGVWEKRFKSLKEQSLGTNRQKLAKRVKALNGPYRT